MIHMGSCLTSSPQHLFGSIRGDVMVPPGLGQDLGQLLLCHHSLPHGSISVDPKPLEGDGWASVNST